MARNDLLIQLVKVWRNLSRTYDGPAGIAYRDCADSLSRAIGLPAELSTLQHVALLEGDAGATARAMLSEPAGNPGRSLCQCGALPGEKHVIGCLAR